MSDFATQRLAMVDSQVRPNDVTDLRLQRALMDVARERFVPPHLQSVAYMEGCPEVQTGRFLLDPRCFAKLAQLAGIRAGDTVLDVGCATGYSSAILARLAERVVALEEDERLVKAARENLQGLSNVRVVHGALTGGHAAGGPYDVIFLNGAAQKRPEILLQQLKDGGRLVGVVSEGGTARARLYLKADGAFSERAAFDAQVPTLPGFAREIGFVF